MKTKKEKSKEGGARKEMRLNMPRTPAAGLDLGEEFSVVTMYSPLGEIAERFNFSMDDEGYSLFSSKIPRDARIGYEASTTAYSVDRRLRAMGYQDITVAHPKELALIVRSKKKNDRADSEKIARLLFMDMLPESHLLTREEQIVRDLLIQRVKLGAEIRRMKNSVISYLKREDVFASLPKTDDNFSLTRTEAIDALAFGDDRDLVLRTMMEKLRFYEGRCTPLEERVMDLVKDHEDVRLLMTIPGVDYYLASLFSSYVRDVNRFPSIDHLASFFGITRRWPLCEHLHELSVGCHEHSALLSGLNHEDGQLPGFVTGPLHLVAAFYGVEEAHVRRPGEHREPQLLEQFLQTVVRRIKVDCRDALTMDVLQCAREQVQTGFGRPELFPYMDFGYAGVPADVRIEQRVGGQEPV